MASRAEWQKPLDALRDDLKTLGDAGGEERAAKIAAIFGVTSAWSAEQKVFTMGQLEPAVAIEACRAGAAMWWEALAGATYFGQLDALRALYAAMQENMGKSADKPDLSTTMTWGAWNYSIAQGAPPVMNAGVLNQLFDWGADPLYKSWNGDSYYTKALDTAAADVIHAFLSHHAPVQQAEQARDNYLRNGNYKRAQEIQQALGLGGFYVKVDNQTLMETKYIAEAGAYGTLRTVFNFGARRVNEIFEFGGSPAAMTSCAFDDYDRPAIGRAREILEKLGGHPDDAALLPDKPRRPGLGR